MEAALKQLVAVAPMPSPTMRWVILMLITNQQLDVAEILLKRIGTSATRPVYSR